VGRPNHPLVEDSFRPLREEADRLRNALSQLRDGIARAGAGGGGGNSAAVAEARELAREERDRAREWREQKKDLRELGQDFRDLQQAVRAAGPLAKQMGLEQTRLQLEAVSQRLDLVRPGFAAIVSSVKLLGSLWKPILAAVAVFGGGLIGVQKLILATTGASLSLKETVQAVGVSLVKAYYDAKVAARDFYIEAIGGREKLDQIAGRTNLINELAAEGTGRTPQRVGLGQTEDEINQQALAATLEELMSRGAQGTRDAAGLFRELFTDITAGLEGILPTIDETQTRARQAVEAFADPTPFEAFKANLESMANLTQVTFDLMLSGIQAVSGTIAATLVDAFTDPHKDIRERFADLFKQLAQMVLQFVIQAAIAKAILTVVGGAATGGVGAGLFFNAGGQVPQGFAAGGRVRGGGRASLAHLFAGGLALGGPPPGVPASDTVPAWLTPGEWVQPVAAVKEYGAGVMEAIRTRAIPAGILQALAAGVRAPSAPSLPRLGYATGGAVAGGGVSGGATPMIVPALIANEHTGEQILAGSRGAHLRFFAENADAIRAAIGV
jgi:hypothetical protein